MEPSNAARAASHLRPWRSLVPNLGRHLRHPLVITGGSLMVVLRWFHGSYPLVNVYQNTMERSTMVTIVNGKTHELSMAMFNSHVNWLEGRWGIQASPNTSPNARFMGGPQYTWRDVGMSNPINLGKLKWFTQLSYWTWPFTVDLPTRSSDFPHLC